MDAIRKQIRTRFVALMLGLSLVVAVAPPVSADEYEPSRAGHPVRIAAYILHPIGVIADYLIMRPAHWIGSKQPFRTLFGHTDEDL